MVIQPLRQPLWLPLRFLGGVIAALAVTLLLFVLAMQPPVADFRAMTVFLSVTALISLVVGYGAYRLGWIERSPSLRWTLVSSYALAGGLTFINVWVTARLMFINEHDLTLAALLLIFAAGIATALGYFYAASIADNIQALVEAAAFVAQGRFDVRVAVRGRDEVATLAQAFNGMAAQLQEAEQKQRELESLRRNLIAWIGHDLRTPLAAVRARVEALADGLVTEPPEVQRYLDTAQRDIRALAGLIDDLFEMAQVDAGGLRLELQPISFSDLVSDTLESFTQIAAEKQVTLTGDVQPGVDPVLCDARQIGRLLNNLLGNALRHTPAGGTVQVQAWATGPQLQLIVRDSGEGILPEDLPYIFTQFYRGEQSRSRETGGAGLGLAIVSSVVAAHHGRIEVSSQPGAGAVFLVTLPKNGRVANPFVRR